MAKSTEVAVAEPNEIDTSDLEASLAADNQANLDRADVQIPLLKIGQALTKEVQDGEASAGEFINSLTGESLGTEVEMVIAGYQKGRFDHGDRQKGIRARKAYGARTVPWTDDPFYGQPFTEHPDAEEQYSKRVNDGEIEWGKGPRISTTYDFTGFVTVPADVEADDVEAPEEPMPVCLSLKRTDKAQAKKLVTLLDAVLRGRYWDAVFVLTTTRSQKDGASYYNVNIRKSRKTTPDEKQRAIQLALALRDQNVEVVGDEDGAAPVAQPQSTGGIEV